jgi:hypothetical protein
MWYTGIAMEVFGTSRVGYARYHGSVGRRLASLCVYAVRV